MRKGQHGHVILRLIRGRATPPAVESLRAALGDAIGGRRPGPRGPLRVILATRPSGDLVELVVLSFWDSAEAATRADARGASPLLITRAAIPEVEATHFEVDQAVQREAHRAPSAVRIATGSFSRHGTDIEMLELLRERAPSIEPAMTEAYVGRRISGRAVEVTFISLWQAPPTEQALDAPFWPDIALRYDAFDLAVFTPLELRRE